MSGLKNLLREAAREARGETITPARTPAYKRRLADPNLPPEKRREVVKDLRVEALVRRAEPTARARARGRHRSTKDAREHDEAAQAEAGGRRRISPREFKVEELCYADLLERVRPIKELDALVRCPGRPIPNVGSILKIAQSEVRKWGGRSKQDTGPERQLRTKLPLIRELEGTLSTDPSANPIILVPCNKSAPVNLLNVGRLLQEGLYTKADLEATRWFESTRKEYVEVARNIDGKMWIFEVRDSAKNFTSSQWKRVVAVIVDGSEWQFSGWPFSNIVDLFTTTKGIYFRKGGTLTPLHVRDWAVSILEMQEQEHQHRFAEIRDAFWVEISNWLLSYRLKKFSTTGKKLDKVHVSTEKPLPVL